MQQMLLAFLLLPTVFYFGLLTRSLHRLDSKLLIEIYISAFCAKSTPALKFWTKHRTLTVLHNQGIVECNSKRGEP